MIHFTRLYYTVLVAALLASAAPLTAQNGNLPFAVYLEGECAEVGANWEKQVDSLAARDTFVVYPSGSSTANPPEDIPANRVTFRVNVQAADDYYVWGRVKSAAADQDSYWVRVNGGDWFVWGNRIRRGNSWLWEDVEGSPYAATAGEFVIEFAYREPQTKLDKIYISTLRNSPSGEGGPGINCDTETDCERYPESCASAAWIEAECGMLGSEVKYTVNTNVSNSGYVEMTRPGQVSGPPSDTATSSQIVFDTELADAGEYFLYFRLNAQDEGANSFWVKVDDGEWIDYSFDIGGGTLLTEGFEWKLVNLAGDSTSFDLDAGSHTITVAKREFGTQLDKIYLGMNSAAPTGFGAVALNCQANSATDLSPVRAPLDLSSVLGVFPNPTGNQLNFRLQNSQNGPVTVAVYDINGRLLSQRQVIKRGDVVQDQVDVSALPAGVYRLVLTGQTGVVSSTFIKQ